MIIGLHGRKGSGKDTSYELLRELRSFAERMAFADNLKLSAARAVGIQGSEEESIALINRVKQPGWEVIVREPDGHEYPITGRQFLQFYGDEAHRQVFGPTFWIDQILPTDLDHSRRCIVITDVRYVNEACRIHFLGGEVWRITRPAIAEEDEHASEQNLSSRYVDRHILNEGTLDDLKDKLREALFEYDRRRNHFARSL